MCLCVSRFVCLCAMWLLECGGKPKSWFITGEQFEFQFLFPSFRAPEFLS